jgi:hypothetical protein
MSKRDPSVLPAPKRVTHRRTLFWWLGVLVLATLVRWVQGQYTVLPAERVRTPGIEPEAFVSVVIGKVSERDEQAIAPRTMAEQLRRLREAGYNSIRLEEARAFLHEGRPLPVRPVLIVFDQARRETVEHVEPVLAELGMNAVACSSSRRATGSRR